MGNLQVNSAVAGQLRAGRFFLAAKVAGDFIHTRLSPVGTTRRCVGYIADAVKVQACSSNTRHNKKSSKLHISGPVGLNVVVDAAKPTALGGICINLSAFPVAIMRIFDVMCKVRKSALT